MCLALPARVAALLPDEMATVDLGGVRKDISIALTPEARVGDYVIVHVGHAIGQIDADHAFEIPVKSHSDIRVGQRLVDSGLVDQKFVFDVIAVDMTRPLISPQRCGLLRLLPDGPAKQGWQAQFRQSGGMEIVRCYQDFMQRLGDAVGAQDQQVAQAQTLMERSRLELIERHPHPALRLRSRVVR